MVASPPITTSIINKLSTFLVLFLFKIIKMAHFWRTEIIKQTSHNPNSIVLRIDTPRPISGQNKRSAFGQ